MINESNDMGEPVDISQIANNGKWYQALGMADVLNPLPHGGFLMGVILEEWPSVQEDGKLSSMIAVTYRSDKIFGTPRVLDAKARIKGTFILGIPFYVEACYDSSVYIWTGL